jgi:phosphatidylglycerophosphate synthase
VTAARAFYAALLLAYALAALWRGDSPSAALRWFWVVGGLGALALDGIDGRVARRLGQANAFGARFDMETDAATVLGLSLLVWLSGQAAAWVLASGAMRYIFIAGSWSWPALSGPLPPRKRRQAICVIQVSALLVSAAPAIPAPAATLLCLGGLALVSYSFAVDIAWLIARPSDAERKEEVVV